MQNERTERSEISLESNNNQYNLPDYQNQLQQKVDIIKKDFYDFYSKELEIFPSPEKHYRMRAEFRIWHSGDSANYAMFAQNTENKGKHPYPVLDFPVGSQLMNELMVDIMRAIHKYPLLKEKLFQVDFFTTQTNQALVTFIYHKPLTDEWTTVAKQLKTQLNINIIGRSRKQRIVIDKDYVVERMAVAGREYYYQQVETGFTQPNASICSAMLNWAAKHSVHFGGDLLELYCGNGNFTLPLSRNFNKILATEVSSPSVTSAQYNIKQNEIKNIQIVRMSSEEFTQAMDQVRAFNRMREVNLAEYDFSTLLVDPPRAGLDANTLELAKRFDNIIYISCNPNTLRNNLYELKKTHQITKFALFDQFPYTNHAELGIVLQKTSTDI
jgi:tRNA (uracil-5-)-methyltransferase